eukprot:TRINITY_DN2834_c0_g1_i2.p1 TRINITY_DN2834_c0_g1~~TRINITY_DN2834_c0_g1_i2.p1  ORF type:complete len:224 (+),score=43.52 TRINITY_DN2834_c0_g1_i2:83-754(+)
MCIRDRVKGIPLKTYLHKKENTSASEAEKIALFKQIAMAIAYCHSKSVAHRDLKMENILITPQNYVKIIDFGFSVRTKPDWKCKILCGTPNYMAPEIISKHEYYPHPTDVWALGVIFYYILTGVFPFQSNLAQPVGSSSTELEGRIAKGIFVLPENLLPQVQQLLVGMLQVDPAKRLTLVQVLQNEAFYGKAKKECVRVFNLHVRYTTLLAYDAMLHVLHELS